jgi:uncharacterized protein YjaG (DUF416 family)
LLGENKKMNKYEITAQLEDMTLEQARREIASGKFGDPTTIVHNFASQWLMVKESEERDKRDALNVSISRKALRNSTWANIIAISATILSAIAIIIAWFTK